MMGMQVGVFPAVKSEDGEWRFIVMEIGNDSRDSKRVIFGTEPEEDGMKEPKFREFLAAQHGMSSAQVDEAVKSAIAKATASPS